MGRKFLSSDLSVKGLEDLCKEVEKLTKGTKTLNELFINNSLLWIKQEIIELSNESASGYSSGEMISEGSWVIINANGVGILRNISDHVAFFEFGIGVVGSTNPHPEATIRGYKYDVDSKYKKYADTQGGYRAWIFAGKPFDGYQGRRVFFNALQNYLYQGGKMAAMDMAFSQWVV